MFSSQSIMKMPNRSGPRWGQVAASRHRPLGDVRPSVSTIRVVQPPSPIHLHLHAARASPHRQVSFPGPHESTSNTCPLQSSNPGPTLLDSPSHSPLEKENEPNLDGPSYRLVVPLP